MVKRLAYIVSLVILHAIFIAAIVYAWQPISKWYLTQKPAIGVDLYNSITYVSYHLKHFSLPFNSFKDFWFGGYPLIKDFPQLTFYLMMPFAKVLGVGVGVQTFAMVSLLAICVSCYLLFFQLSKNFGLSLFLAVLVLLSPTIYGTAIWAGSLPYFASEAFFPLGLFFVAKYFEKADVKHLLIASLVTGLGILLNPLGIVAFLIPAAVLLIIAGGFIGKLKPLRIVKHLFAYLVGTLLTGFIFLYDYLLTAITHLTAPSFIVPTITKESGPVSSGAKAIADFYNGQISQLYTGTNWWIFALVVIGAGAFLIGLPIAKNRRRAIAILGFGLIALYTAAHPALNLSGKMIFLKHDIYRAFWAFTISLAALAAFLWGFFFTSIYERVIHHVKSHYVKIVSIFLVLGISVIFASLTYKIYKEQIAGLITYLGGHSELSSAYPEALSVEVGKDKLTEIKKQVVPSFMDPNDKNKRLYSADASVNIWWNGFFDMPQVRGYIDPPIATQNRGGLFWLDIAIANNSLTRDFKVPEDQAFKNTLFLMDWYAVNYLEGGRLSSKGPNPGPSDYLVKNKIFDKDEMTTAYGAVLKYQTASGKPELHMDIPQYMHFYKVADQYASPILAPNNSPAVLIITEEASYEDILRILAADNINSRMLIPAYGGNNLNKIKRGDLKAFDAVILHQYVSSDDKAFSVLEDYVKRGGKLFIDTGSDVRQSSSSNLPEVFPIKNSQRKGVGRSWEFSVNQDKITEGVDFAKFGPPLFNDAEWKVAGPKNSDDLRDDTKVILKNKNNPLLVKRKIGDGTVIWSGMNLAYHFNQHKSLDEARLFINILKDFTNIEQHSIEPAKTTWSNNENVTIAADRKPRGILFKEQGWKGWHASVVSPINQDVPIYLAGPTYPGFMYVPLNQVKVDGPIKLKFTYTGIFIYWLAAFVNIAAILVILDKVLINGRIFGGVTNFIWKRFSKKTASWWEKEE